MADNVLITPGSGDTIAADDIGGVKHQRVKISVGAEGAAADWAGAVSGPLTDAELRAAAVPVEPPIDEDTGAVLTIDFAHHEIHEGDAFTASYTADLANGAVRDFLLVTPNTDKLAHFTWAVDFELEGHVTIYEGSTATPGTAIAIMNRNRVGNPAASGLSLTHTPTGITTGTVILRDAHAGSGKLISGSRVDAREFVLKKATNYLIRVTNATTSDNYISVWLDWYEHTDLA